MPVEHLHLEPLLEQDYDELLAGAATAVTRRRLHRESGGNPEYLRVLSAEQSLSTAPLNGGPVPRPSRSDCYAAFDKELAPPAPETRGVAEAAAVLGDESEVGLVAELLGLPPATVLGAIGVLSRRDLIRPVVPGRYFAFRHPVVRRAVHHSGELGRRGVRAGAGPARRAVRRPRRPGGDRAVGERRAGRLAGRPERRLLLARHGVARAAPGGRARPAAGPADAAAGRGAGPVRAAAGLPPPDAPDLGAAPRRGPRRARRRGRLAGQGAAAAGPPGGDRRAPAPRAGGPRRGGHPGLRDAHVRGVHRAAAPRRPGRRLPGRRRGAGRRRPAPRPAAARLRAGGDGDGRQRERAARSGPGPPRERHRDAGRHAGRRTLAQSLDATVWIGWSGVLLERWDDALRHFHKGAEFAARSGSRLFLPHLLAGQAYVLCERARLAEARSAAEHAVYLAELSGSPEALVHTYAVLAYVDIARGRRPEALASARKAVVEPPRSAGGWKRMMALRALSGAKLLDGDAEGCLALVAEAGGPDLPQAGAGSRVAWYELLTRAALALGQFEAAAARLGGPGRYALAELARAQVLSAGRREDVVPTAQQAVQGLEPAGRSLDALRARVVLGRRCGSRAGPRRPGGS
nr:hypothetical protein [Kitasatospora sp. SID7827]